VGGSASHRFGDGHLNIGQIVADHLLEVSLHLVRHHEVVSLRIVGLAIVPNQLDMVKHLLNRPILPALQPILHLSQMHGVLHQKGVVMELQFFLKEGVHYQSTGLTNSAESGNSITYCRIWESFFYSSRPM